MAKRYRDEASETVRRYRRMLGGTLPDGYGRCRKAVRNPNPRDDLAIARDAFAE